MTEDAKKFTDHPAHESFERGFRLGISGCRARCACGVEYWDAHNTGYDWDEGELEHLGSAESKAVALDHSVGFVQFEGREYVDGCTCWHKRALMILGFLTTHDDEIAKFLTLEKARKTAEAEQSPVVV